MKVFAHTRQLMNRFDASRLETGGIANPGKLKKLRGIDGACGKNDFTVGFGPPYLAMFGVFDAVRPLVIEQDPLDKSSCLQLEIATA